MDEKLKNKETLLVVNKSDGNKVKVVKGVDDTGNLDTVDATKANQGQFIRIDEKAGVLENFFSNLKREFQDPTHFNFFRSPIEKIENIASALKEMFKDEAGNTAFLSQSRVNPEDFNKQQKTQDQSQEYKPVDESRINWRQLEKLGVTREMLEAQGNLKAMLNWHKSPNLIQVNPTYEGIAFQVQARLSFDENPDGSIRLKADSYQPASTLDIPFHGATLTEEDKKNLLETSNAGRIIELTGDKGEKIPSFVSLDKVTNRLEAIPVANVAFKDTLKEAPLSSEQLQSLYEGKKTLVEGMTSKNGKPFDGYVQFNAAKGSLDFSYDGLDRNKYRQENQQSQNQEPQQKVRIPTKLLGVDLDEKQQSSLGEGKAIYVQGMMKDGQDQPFNAYVKVNEEKGKLDFFKWNPDKAKSQGAEVKPAEANKTQVAVNSEGKTSESLKNVKDPIKQGQSSPTEKQAEKQKETQRPARTVKKSGGVKM
ncbi:DUF3945 domain-containing protein [Dysgonomonas sp. GY75]|uniref:DUF4099 domain-containing protein n=1 Tax=Dysgonomonas sp. GY75 TaxID=2780419 RepID=UPI0018838FAF|nr:DUF3945 domain-containing protein [Dysgonomonas sp. GY75]MBF0647867.1 DUF3945 domain-containing protein [Dysgonomonas sp. GY75]